MVKQYRKKPVVISAVQWTGNNEVEINKFVPEFKRVWEGNELYIVTLEGNHFATIGDFIIQGIRGDDFYPCKPDIFENSYDEVGEDE